MAKYFGRLAGMRALVCASTAALLSASALMTFTLASASEAEAKTPGKTYCFYRTCHRVKTIAETEALIGFKETVQASHYDDCSRDRYNPCGLTSSGERFRSDRPDNVASPIYPDGTTLLLWSPSTRNAAVVRVNNAGPYWGKRKIDVSRATAEHLGFAGQGIASIEVRVLSAPTREEATYRRNRQYRPVPGYLGKYSDTELAHSSAAAIMAVDDVVVAMLTPPAGTAVASKAPEPKPATPAEPVRVAVAEAHARMPELIGPAPQVAAAALPAAPAEDAIEARKRIAAANARKSNSARYASQAKKRVAARYASAKPSAVAKPTLAAAKPVSGDVNVAALAPQPPQEAVKRRPRDVSASAWSVNRGPAFFRPEEEQQQMPQAASGAPLRKTAWKSVASANRS